MRTYNESYIIFIYNSIAAELTLFYIFGGSNIPWKKILGACEPVANYVTRHTFG